MKHEMPPIGEQEKGGEKEIKNPEAREPLWVDLVEGQLSGVEDEKRREGLADVIEDTKQKALEYLQLTIRLSKHAAKMQFDSGHKDTVERIDHDRRIKHNAIISDFDIIARNYGKEDLDISWYKQFQSPDQDRSRELKGNWAFKIAIGELAAHFPKPERELLLDDPLVEGAAKSGGFNDEALNVVSMMIDEYLKPEDQEIALDAASSIKHIKKYFPDLKLSDTEARDLVL